MSRNYFSIKTKDSSQVEQIKSQKSGVVITNLNVLLDKIQINDFVFVVFGGDRPENWKPGLVALAHISRLPYDMIGKNFSVDIDIDLYFEPITRADLLPYPDTYGIIGIAPIVKWEPNQALSQIAEDRVLDLMQAILELRIEHKDRIEGIIGENLLAKLSEKKLHRYIKVDSKLYSKEYSIGSVELDEIESRQVIYYGAPGTGKSNKIKRLLESNNIAKSNIFRTTFHPDSDYSTFVGVYKPKKGTRPLYGLNGGLTVRLKDGNKELEEDIITYSFVPQAFLNAYMQAYRKPEEKVYLIIEEINRGNCAQIFGDLFQLLDRDKNGVSEYAIKADADLRAFLEDELGKDNIGIKDGELRLPSNLYIYATMNTSDQSLFPIDSAFKRRWDWEYEPIKYKNIDWVIDIDGLKYRWCDFQREVNNRILKDTGSEDKMLGDYFVNPPAKVISYDLFRNKILFYLWNDVCKDGDADIFPTDEDFSFSKLYDEDSRRYIVSMMDKLNLQPIDENNVEDNEEEDDTSEVEDDNTTSVRYSINGEEIDEKGKAWKKGPLVKRAVEIYCDNHPEYTAAQIRDVWMSVGFKIPHIVETDEDRERRINNSTDSRAEKRSKEIKLRNGESIHVSTQVGDDRVYQNFTDFLAKIKSKPEWEINIQEL